jgi:hypothetical protein
VFGVSDLQRPLAVLPARAEAEVTALDLSADGQLLAVAAGQPGPALAVWQWRKEQLLASAPAPAPLCCVRFHPADPGRLLTLAAPDAGGCGWLDGLPEGAPVQPPRRVGAQAWALERLWSGYSLAPERQLPASPLGGRATCLAWAPEVRGGGGGQGGVTAGCLGYRYGCIRATR